MKLKGRLGHPRDHLGLLEARLGLARPLSLGIYLDGVLGSKFQQVSNLRIQTALSGVRPGKFPSHYDRSALGMSFFSLVSLLPKSIVRR